MTQFRRAFREAAGMFGLTAEGRERNKAANTKAPYLRWIVILPVALLIVAIVVPGGTAFWIVKGLVAFVLVVWIGLRMRVDRRLPR